MGMLAFMHSTGGNRMRHLRLGMHGHDVGLLQGKLKAFVPELSADERFGPRTERAVRVAQRRLALFPPDGIAGPRTMAVLFKSSVGASAKTADKSTWMSSGAAAASSFGRTTKLMEDAIAGWLKQHLTASTPVPAPIRKAVTPAMHRAEHAPAPPSVVAPVAGMRMSAQGRLFIIRHEGQAGVSNHLHHPSMGSGVTLGPGYDMKDRTRAQVAGDLKSIFGVDPAAADKAAEGAGKHGKAARDFVRENKKVIDLSPSQQAALLANIIGHYEGMVRRAVKIPLHQYEFDALVSYAYNPGGGWKKTIALVNQYKPQDATIEISRHVYSKGQRIHSLVVRRAAETRVLLYGEYR